MHLLEQIQYQRKLKTVNDILGAHLVSHADKGNRLNLRQSVCDVVVGSGEIIVDDIKYTVSHVVEPVERGLEKKQTKDDSYVIPLSSWSKEFSDVHKDLPEGCCSDSSLPGVKRKYSHSKESVSRFKHT